MEVDPSAMMLNKHCVRAGLQLGYCTNVHAGSDLQTTLDNLQRHAVAVKQQISPDQPLGIGLWLSASAATSLLDEQRVSEFAAWLEDQGILPFTLNGFPYGDFHQDVVKHQVYRPTWMDPDRLAYTRKLISILDQILPPGLEGSISTLPLCWGQPQPTAGQFRAAASQLQMIARDLADLEQRTGRLIYVCLEPEPGCVLQRSEDMVRFFQDHLLSMEHEVQVDRYLRVCHDVCHAAVMFEGQREALQRYRAAGVQVGKIQISSAVCLNLPRLADQHRQAAVQQLSGFAERRYLHQTVVRSADGELAFYEDLPAALADAEQRPAMMQSEWRVHYHVPVYLERFGHLDTSRAEIHECMQAARQLLQVNHYEVETYAWDVLPDELRQPSLAAGIGRELVWLDDLVGTM